MFTFNRVAICLWVGLTAVFLFAKKPAHGNFQAARNGSDLISAAEAGRLLDGALENAFDGIISDFKPTIRWIYKDVTYETIHNRDFREGLEKGFGASRADKLFSEYDAAPEN